MPKAIIASQIQIGGTQMSASNTLTGNAQESYSPTTDPVAAQEGTLDTRTDADTGVVGCSTGHGIETGDKVVVSWTESGVRKSRTDMDATVSGDNVTIDGGDGDDLPAEDSTVNVAVQTDMAASFDGDDLVAIGATASRDTTLVFYDSGDAVLLKTELYAGSAWIWQSGAGTSTPITGNAVARIAIGNRDTAGAVAFNLGLLQNV